MKLFIYCFIFILFFIIISNGQLSVVDITVDKDNARHRYANQDSGNCTGYKFDVVVTDPTTTNFLGLVLSSTNSLSNSFDTGIYNSTARLFRVDSVSIIPTGPNIITLVGTDGTNQVPLSIPILCELIPLSDIIFDKLTEFKPNVFGDISATWKLIGLQYPFTLDNSFSGTNVYSKRVAPDNFLSTLASKEEFSTNTIVNYGASSVTQKIINYYNNNNYVNVFDFKLYPENQNQIVLMGDLVLPLITWRSNTTYYSPPFSIRVNGYPTNLGFRLISTNSLGESKYIGYLDGTILPGVSSKYQLSSQNGINLYLAKTIDNIMVSGFNSNQFPVATTINSITQSKTIITVKFDSSNEYIYSPIFISHLHTRNFGFPFGFIYGSNTNGFKYEANFLLPDYLTGSASFIVSQSIGNQLFSVNNIISPIPIIGIPSLPLFGGYEFIHVYGHNYILRLSFQYEYPVYRISTKVANYNAASLSSGDKNGGVYELFVNTLERVDIILINDKYDSNPNGFLYALNQPEPFIIPPVFNSGFNYYDIRNTSILYKTMDVTNQQAGNILYFNYTGLDVNTPISLLVNGPASSNTQQPHFYLDHVLSNKLWPAKYNSTIKLFQVEFWLPKNSQPGQEIPFALFFDYKMFVFSNQMSQDAQFSVISNNADLYGPIFSSITKYPSGNPIQITSNIKIGWELTIQDEINGFKNGTVTVRGSVDGSVYNFKLVATSNIYTDKYIVEISLTNGCIPQDYLITNVLLYDTENNNSTFSTFSTTEKSILESMYNPFINYIYDSNINRLSVVCDTQVVDSTPPVISKFQISKRIIDVGGTEQDRIVSIQFNAISGSGFKLGHYPIVYLSAVNLENVECVASTAFYISETEMNFQCTVTLPIGFGYPFKIIPSVYGMVNNGGYYGGCTNNGIYSLFNDKFEISTTLTINQPQIIGSDRISTKGGQLWINGRGFKNVNSATITHSLFNGSVTISKIVGTSAILLDKIPALTTTFSITVHTSDSKSSNSFNVTPFIKDIEPTVPVPTNKPQQCLGTPECGGIDKGYCSLTGCICISPWIGIDCSSKVIIVPPPLTNPSNPSTEIPIIDGTDNETSNYMFKSLISIVSLREFDFQNNIVKNHTFDKWILTPIDELSNRYFTNISVISAIDGTTTISNITIKLQWFKQETNITFANEQLIMQASSMKYTIELSEYKFENQLNTLQLVMMASLESSKTNDICSKSEFGETSTGDNSNYIKIQIDNKSLYGRFIKRAIVDSMISSVNNIPLDSSFNPIKEASTLQSYIGINVPNFKSTIIIDPDFSVLLDNESASNNDNDSICNISKSALTTSQLAGIIVGSVVFFIAIVGVALFIFIRNRKHTLLLLRIKDIGMYKK